MGAEEGDTEAVEGVFEGEFEGALEGDIEGSTVVGDPVDPFDGDSEGWVDGLDVGEADGSDDAIVGAGTGAGVV